MNYRAEGSCLDRHKSQPRAYGSRTLARSHIVSIAPSVLQVGRELKSSMPDQGNGLKFPPNLSVTISQAGQPDNL